jgi:hypothetical protein
LRVIQVVDPEAVNQMEMVCILGNDHTL